MGVNLSVFQSQSYRLVADYSGVMGPYPSLLALLFSVPSRLAAIDMTGPTSVEAQGGLSAPACSA